MYVYPSSRSSNTAICEEKINVPIWLQNRCTVNIYLEKQDLCYYPSRNYTAVHILYCCQMTTFDLMNEYYATANHSSMVLFSTAFGNIGVLICHANKGYLNLIVSLIQLSPHPALTFCSGQQPHSPVCSRQQVVRSGH